MPNPIRMFRRLKRKVLPRKTRRLISGYVWRFTGVILLAGGIVIALWGVVLFFKPHPATDANGIPVNDSAKRTTYLIVGLAVSTLGYSIRKIYHHSRGQIDSRFIKDSKQAPD
jgi:hypothetical protein